jgi:hypothetical protein
MGYLLLLTINTKSRIFLIIFFESTFSATEENIEYLKLEQKKNVSTPFVFDQNLIKNIEVEFSMKTGTSTPLFITK